MNQLVKSQSEPLRATLLHGAQHALSVLVYDYIPTLFVAISTSYWFYSYNVRNNFQNEEMATNRYFENVPIETYNTYHLWLDLAAWIIPVLQTITQVGTEISINVILPALLWLAKLFLNLISKFQLQHILVFLITFFITIKYKRNKKNEEKRKEEQQKRERTAANNITINANIQQIFPLLSNLNPIYATNTLSTDHIKSETITTNSIPTITINPETHPFIDNYRISEPSTNHYSIPHVNFYNKNAPFLSHIILDIYRKQYDPRKLVNAISLAAIYNPHPFVNKLEEKMETDPWENKHEFAKYLLNEFPADYRERATKFLLDISNKPATSSQALIESLSSWLNKGFFMVTINNIDAMTFSIHFGPFRNYEEKAGLELLASQADNYYHFLSLIYNSLLKSNDYKTDINLDTLELKKEEKELTFKKKRKGAKEEREERKKTEEETEKKKEEDEKRKEKAKTTNHKKKYSNKKKSKPATEPEASNRNGESNELITKTIQLNNIFTDHREGYTLPSHQIWFTFDEQQKPFYGLVDTGAVSSIISKNIIEEYGLPTIQPENNEKIRIKTILMEKLIPAVTCTVEIAIKNNFYTETFIVLPDIDDIIILGYPFLQRYEEELPDPIKVETSITNTLLKRVFKNYNPGPITLPDCRETDYKFDLIQPIETLEQDRHHRHSLQDEEFMEKEVEELLKKQFITPASSNSYYATPFVARKGKKPRMVLEYQALNSITRVIPKRIPNFEKLTVGLHGQYMSALDLSSAYHHLRLAPETQKYTTFRVGDNFYNWQVLPFGLSNAPEVFSRFIGSVLASTKEFCRIYLDDILIFSDSLEEHEEHLKKVVKILQKEKLHINLLKSQFFKKEVVWVGHKLISNEKNEILIAPRDQNCEIIRNFPIPTSKRKLQQFLGHLTYISPFLPGYHLLTAPLYEILKESNTSKFIWTEEATESFEALKKLEENQLALHAFNPKLKTKLTTDASEVAVGAVLWQESEDIWHPVFYRSYTFSSVQKRWNTKDKELYAIKMAVEKLRFYITAVQSVIIETDHKNLVSFFKREELTAKQARWLEDLVGYNLTIQYLPGKNNQIADYLSRWPTYTKSGIPPLPNEEAYLNHITITPHQKWINKLIESYEDDEYCAKIIDKLSDNKYNDFYRAHDTNYLYYKNRLVIPQKYIQQVLDDFHSNCLSGHPGINRMQKWLSKHFYFPRMYPIIEEYVKSCETCNRVNPPNRTLGLMQQPTIPVTRWSHISMDIVSGFTSTSFQGREVDSALVVLDIFSNRVHFYPISNKFSGVDISKYLLEIYYPLHGIPEVITSDRGPQFTAEIFMNLCTALQCSQNLCITNHHQSNGKVERMIRSLQHYLRSIVTENKDWAYYIPAAEFTLNSTPSMALGGLSPFEVDIGYIPHSPLTLSYQLSDKGRIIDEISENFEKYEITARAATNLIFETNKAKFDSNKKEGELEEGDDVYILQDALAKPGDAHNKNLVQAFRSKYVGPYKVSKKINSVNYELELPSSSKRNSPFHISQLKKQSALPKALFTAPKVINPLYEYKDGSVETEIEELISHRKVAKGHKILVKFKDGTEQEVTLGELRKSASNLLQEYIENHPELKEVLDKRRG